MENVILIVIVLSVLLVGLSSTFRGLPALIFLGLFLFFLGWFTVKFFWIILALILVQSLVKAVQPKTTRRTQYTYRTYSQQEFEEFFRRATGGAYQGNAQGNSYERGQQNPYGYFEDLTKYYAILGVEKGASKEEIKKAYFKKVKEHHPDHFATASEEEKKYHEETLKQINEAYDKIEKNNTV